MIMPYHSGDYKSNSTAQIFLAQLVIIQLVRKFPAFMRFKG
jgi:hypothetical protein